MAKLDKGKSVSKRTVEPPKIPPVSESNQAYAMRLVQKINERKLYLNSPIVFSFIFIISLFGIVNYLFRLKNCICFEERNQEHKANLNYLLSIDIILLVFYVFLFGTLLYYSSSSSVRPSLSVPNMLTIVRNLKTFYYVMLSIIAVLILLTLFFLFYIYKLSLSLDDSCECSNSKLKYLLYAQGVLSTLFLVGLFVTVYNLLSIAE